MNGDLYRIGEYKSLASSKSDSAIQYKKAKKNYFLSHGILTYKRCLSIWNACFVSKKDLPSLLCKRFSYVFIDEFQDCSQMQREVLSCIFDKNKVLHFFKIGDRIKRYMLGIKIIR